MQSADDSAIWAHALSQQAVLLTKDEDFADRWLLGGQQVPLVWIRLGNCSNTTLLAWLTPLWPEVMARLEQGERIVELRA